MPDEVEFRTEAKSALRIVEGAGDDRPEVILSQELSDVADKACEHLASDPEIFQRAGSLVHVVTPTALAPGLKVWPVIRELPLSILHVRMSQIARWLRFDARTKGYRRVNVPKDIVSAVHQRGQWDAVRPLVGVLTAPTVRSDGTVLQSPGYDRQTGLLLWPDLTFVEVADHPTLDDARNAADAILDLVCDFPFAAEADRSAWLAGALTMVARHAIEGPIPLFAVDSNVRGSGKSRLVDVATMIASGTMAPRTPISGNEEESRKMITSILLGGSPAALFDNVRSGGRIGGPSFDALLTSGVWKDRNLGRTQELTLPARTIWWCTGNNLSLGGDLPRRSLKIRLESPLARPETRETFRHGAGDALFRHVERKRFVLVAQALTILRAHALAGWPREGATWGSFESWDRVIGSAVRWLGLANPLDACAASDDSADEDLIFGSAIVNALKAMARPVSARELITELYPMGMYEGEQPPDPHPSYPAAREALEVATKARGTPMPIHVGAFLRRIRGRRFPEGTIVGEIHSHSKIQVWRVREETSS